MYEKARFLGLTSYKFGTLSFSAEGNDEVALAGDLFAPDLVVAPV